jgi:hypothetical protein
VEFVNRRLIAERCRASGLPIHAAAYRAFVDPWVLLDRPIPEQPWRREADDRLPLGLVRLLCQILDVSFNELLDVPGEPPDEPDDDLLVEAALATFPEGLRRDDLARAFTWPLDRVERALGSLEVRLRPSGRRLIPIGSDRFALGANLSILSAGELVQLRRCAKVGRSLDEPEAEVLLKIVGTWCRRRDLNPHVAWDHAQVLLGRGLVVSRDGDYVPSADLLFSLGLDEAPGPRG